MGFLKRRKNRRLCVPASGPACYRGYEYTYTFSKQGLSYLRWLREWKPLEDMFYAKLTYDVVSNLPEDIRDELSMISLRREAFKYRGPTRHLQLFDNSSIPIASLCVAKQKLAEENDRLLIENALLRSQLDQSSKSLEQKKQTEHMLYAYWATTLVEAANLKNEVAPWKAKAEEHLASLQLAKRIIEETRRFSNEKFEQYRASMLALPVPQPSSPRNR